MSHPSLPDFWDERYAAGRTPWDYGGVPPQLRRYVERHPNGGRVLVPGCGAGHEIATFYEAGYDVTAIDFAPAAVARARDNLGPLLAERVILGDFFAHDFGAGGGFDVIYERTFLCALPPKLQGAYRSRMLALLKPGALLVGLFYLGEESGGPPYQLHTADEAQIFSNPGFMLERDEIAESPLAMFGQGERWREYRRN